MLARASKCFQFSITSVVFSCWLVLCLKYCNSGCRQRQITLELLNWSVFFNLPTCLGTCLGMIYETVLIVNLAIEANDSWFPLKLLGIRLAHYIIYIDVWYIIYLLLVSYVYVDSAFTTHHFCTHNSLLH